MDRKYIDRQIGSGKWIRTTLPNGLKVYLAERTSKFIETFESEGDSFCPHFKTIGTGSGTCACMCKGCFLKGTYRTLREPGVPVLHTNLVKCAEELEKDILRSKVPSIYNDGEKCDSLLYDEFYGVTKALLPVFVRHKKKGNRFLRLTKSANVNHLIGLDHQRVMILSYSLNPQRVADLFETNPQATIEERIRKAALAQNEGGYPTRVRIDPIIPTEGWQSHYTAFLEEMAKSKLRPDRITLGSYRVLKRSTNIQKILGEEFVIPLEELEDRDKGQKQARLRIPLERRIEAYSFLIEKIKKMFPSVEIGLCKENEELRRKMGFSDKDMLCNCTL
jgi:spore photoproduct lyase